jgi:hypothetical protein
MMWVVFRESQRRYFGIWGVDKVKVGILLKSKGGISGGREGQVNPIKVRKVKASSRK